MSTESPGFEGRDWKYWTVPELINIEGRQTAYRRKGSGEVLVYLHGGGMTRVWLPFFDELAKHFDVIVPEHPGFGDSERGELESWEDMVLHYDAFFRELGIEDFHLVGHSMGGWLASNLSIFYPERFKTLSLVTATGLRLKDAKLIDVFRWDDEDHGEALFNGRGDRYAEELAQGDGVEQALHEYAESITEALLAWNPRYDIKLDRRLGRVSAPTLIIGVDDDRVVHTEMAARFAELIPHARLEIITDPQEPTGHLVHVEKPQEVAASITSYITSQSTVRS